MKHKKGFVIYIFLVVAYTPDAQAGLVQCVTVRGTSLRRVRVGAGVLVPERVRFFCFVRVFIYWSLVSRPERSRHAMHAVVASCVRSSQRSSSPQVLRAGAVLHTSERSDPY